jgi:hypothetical protein
MLLKWWYLSRIVAKCKQTSSHFVLTIYQQPIKRKKQGEEKRMTQEEMLLEAAKTGNHFLFCFGIWIILYFLRLRGNHQLGIGI